VSYKIQSRKIKGKQVYRVLDVKNNVVNKQPFDDRVKAENLIKHLESQDSLKLVPKPSKPSENMQRLTRLSTQPKGYPGSLLAQQDSAKVETDLPQFKTAATRRKNVEDLNDDLRKLKSKKTVKDKSAAKYKKLIDEATTPFSVTATERVRAETLNAESAELEKDIERLEFKIGVESGNIMFHRKTNTYYKYIGGDKSDPQSWEKVK